METPISKYLNGSHVYISLIYNFLIIVPNIYNFLIVVRNKNSIPPTQHLTQIS